MGAWKDWQLGMIESGATDREIRTAADRIKGTSADPLIRRITDNNLHELARTVTGDDQ